MRECSETKARIEGATIEAPRFAGVYNEAATHEEVYSLAIQTVVWPSEQPAPCTRTEVLQALQNGYFTVFREIRPPGLKKPGGAGGTATS